MHIGSLVLAALLTADAGSGSAAPQVRYVWMHETRLLSAEGAPHEVGPTLQAGQEVLVGLCAEGLCTVTFPDSSQRYRLPEAHLGRTPPTQQELGKKGARALEQACALSPSDTCLRALEAAHLAVGDRKRAAAVATRARELAFKEASRRPVRFARAGHVRRRPSLKNGEQVLAFCPEGPRWLRVHVEEDPKSSSFAVWACKSPPGTAVPWPEYMIAGLPKSKVQMGTVQRTESPDSTAQLGEQVLKTGERRSMAGTSWMVDPKSGRRMQMDFADYARFSFAGELDGDGLMDVIVSVTDCMQFRNEAFLLLSSKSNVKPLPVIVARAEEPAECE
jgi:hypothetical protein